MSSLLLASAAATVALSPASPAPTMIISCVYFSINFTFLKIS